jgi:DNA-binding NarL/FixJ family response regulator
MRFRPEETLDLARSVSPDLVLLDLKMPGLADSI